MGNFIKRFFNQTIPSNHSWYVILLVLTVAIMIVWTKQQLLDPHDLLTVTKDATVQPVQAKTLTERIAEKLEPDNGHQMHVTGFSSVECHSGWCQARQGKGRTVNGKYVAAINTAKYGSQWTKAYVPAYDRTYTLARYNDKDALATATGTDLDIWFGDDQEAALEVNTNVMVYLIK